MMLQQEVSFELNKRFVGKIIPVLIDRIEGDTYIGRTEYDSPEVDNEVVINPKELDVKVGEFYNIVITGSDFFDLVGEPA